MTAAYQQGLEPGSRVRCDTCGNVTRSDAAVRVDATPNAGR